VAVPARQFNRDLPQAARDRLAEIKASGTWSSALSTSEFATIKSVGFEPVGQVLGAAVYYIGNPGGTSCPSFGTRGSTYGRTGYSRPSYTMISGSGSSSAYGPFVNALYEARRRAIRRMSAECDALGGHGIVGVSLTFGPFPEGGIEFRAIGTAVRAPGAVSLKTPFTSDLSGQEFSSLIMAGLVPVSLVLGISVGVRHDDWLTSGQSRWAVGNVEVSGYTELVNRTRRDARNELMLDVSRVNASGVVVKDTTLSIGEQECRGQEGSRDHWAEVTMIGTAITRFAGDRVRNRNRTIAVLSLDPERRASARGSFGRHEHDQSQHLLDAGEQDNQEDADDPSKEQ
jgi:uncharacterized protein YbjQ (UPF0145 family)